MRKILIPLVALVALCGCDNPEDFTHPENPTREVNITPSTTPTDGANTPVTSTPTTTATATPTATETAAPAFPVNPDSDNSPSKSAEANGVTETFDKVNINATLQTDITVGQPSKVTVDCNQNSFDQIKFEIKEGTLNITTDKNFKAARAKVIVSMPTLVAVSSQGNAIVNVTGVTGANFAVSLSGMSSLDVKGEADNVVVSIGDSCLARMKGLTSKQATITSSGKGVVELKCLDRLIATSSGDSVVTVFGMPRKVTKNKTQRSIINLAE